jgi:malonate-semialdehyde dehydrogenase (acetylating)/methylmalonate-semialdehyde dehydrogenase
LSQLPCSSAIDIDIAVTAAQNAFQTWSKTPVKERVQVFYRYKTLLEEHLFELAALGTEENGKTISESVAEIEKCIELTEFACSLPQLITGETLEVSRGVECRAEVVFTDNFAHRDRNRVNNKCVFTLVHLIGKELV